MTSFAAQDAVRAVAALFIVHHAIIRCNFALYAPLQQDQEMPETMPSIDYKCVWQSGRNSARSMSIWRPVGPPGYASLGDIAMPGREPPARPICMYKDSNTLESSKVST